MWRLGLQQVNYEWWNLPGYEESDTWNEPSCIPHPQLHPTFHTRYPSHSSVLSNGKCSSPGALAQFLSLAWKSTWAEHSSTQRSGAESQDAALQCYAEQPAACFRSLPHVGEQEGSVHPEEGTPPEEREACVPCSKNAGSVYKVRHVSTVIVSKVSVKLALLLPRSEGYESNAHRWSATFHNETRLYCPEEAAFHNISIGACFFFYIFYFLCKLWAVLPLSLNQKSRTIKTCFITESWPSICVQWTSFSSLGCWHKHSQPKPERKLEQMQGSEYSQAWGVFELCDFFFLVHTQLPHPKLWRMWGSADMNWHCQLWNIWVPALLWFPEEEQPHRKQMLSFEGD